MENTLGLRLERALREYAPSSVRGDKKAFQRAVEARMGPAHDRPGASYPSILGYFAGRTTPTIDWVRHAAAILDVREEWLAFGNGGATEGEQDALLAKTTWREDLSALDDVVREVFGEIGEYDSAGTDLSFPVRRAIDELALTWFVATGRREDSKVQPEDWRRIAHALAAPLRELDMLPSAFPAPALAHYVLILSEALRHLHASAAWDQTKWG